MKNTINIVLLAVIIAGCQSDFGLNPAMSTPAIIYANSFETLEDIQGWQGYGSREFFPSAPLGAGRQSLRVSGGCLSPHAFFRLVSPPTGCYLVLQCWGRNLARGGEAALERLADRSHRVSVSIPDTVWTSYRSTDSLYCPGSDTLELSLDSGGKSYSAMLVDLLEIKRVK